MSFIRTIFITAVLAFSGMVFAAGAVDINSADAKTLQTLDGVGPSKAQAIIEYRQANGPFKSAADLGKVKGIGDKTLELNRERIVVSGGSAEPAKKKPTAKN
jgi:competence protein ComEA